MYGVYPEFAAREHLTNLPIIARKVLDIAKSNDISSIAVTCGPGLVGSLMVGIMFAKGLGFALKKNVIGINHLEGHALSVRLTNDLEFPFLLLLVSGGHSSIIAVNYPIYIV